MSTGPSNTNELSELLGLLCDGGLTDEQFVELEKLLLHDPEARAYYASYIDMHGGLSRRWSPDFVSRITPLAEPRKRGGLWLAWGVAVAAVAALLATGLTLYFMRTSTVSTEVVANGEEPERASQTMAVLLHSRQAQWETTASVHEKELLELGSYRLRSGAASIQFLSGAVVTLEGPTDLRVDSPWAANCSRGRIRVDVPPQAVGFRIQTPHGFIVDRGTTFGINVLKEKTEVHVLKGQVDIQIENHGTKVLSADQAIAMDNQGFQSLTFNNSHFISPDELQAQADVISRSRKSEWAQANSAIYNDPTLLIYADFEDLSRNPRKLPNKALSSSVSDGTVIGCSVAEGRWPQKGSLEFRTVKDRVRFLVPGQHRALTLCAWVRVDRTERSFNSLLMSDAFNPGAMHWQIRKDGSLRLGVAGKAGGPNADYDTNPIFVGNRLGQWTHLTTVYDSTTATVKHYMDGQLLVQVPMRFEMPLSIGGCELANWTPGPNSSRHYAIRNLEGRIDELHLFSRPLSESEIQAQYLSGAARN